MLGMDSGHCLDFLLALFRAPLFITRLFPPSGSFQVISILCNPTQWGFFMLQAQEIILQTEIFTHKTNNSCIGIQARHLHQQAGWVFQSDSHFSGGWQRGTSISCLSHHHTQCNHVLRSEHRPTLDLLLIISFLIASSRYRLPCVQYLKYFGYDKTGRNLPGQVLRARQGMSVLAHCSSATITAHTFLLFLSGR